MRNHPYLVTFALVFINCSICVADIDGTYLTPENLDKQLLLFDISADEQGRIVVTVEEKEKSAWPNLTVTLLVSDGEATIVTCQLEGKRKGNSQSYEFTIAPKHWGRSALNIYDNNTEAKGLDTEAGSYIVPLKAFATSLKKQRNK